MSKNVIFFHKKLENRRVEYVQSVKDGTGERGKKVGKG
jgi:hypothetical protein